MVPIGRLVVLRTADRRDLIKAITCLTWPGLIAPAPAPVLGGLLAARMVPARRTANTSTLDWGGFLPTGVSLAGVVIGMQRMADASFRWAEAFGRAIGVVTELGPVLARLRALPDDELQAVLERLCVRVLTTDV
ncbi:hypothetical protein LWP59_26070 [Amycolatopsis acidiphila]|uniref:Uncharacterized protein n=1 Tax=Amycolatopsis acidiphila TaxID=715473 RepID=A0A558ADW0_9PSEU|nr:hypothetical protein [Amycolatopsis acidiphila]TVT22403.1 hypothetical protein FNH06_13490 [Amycolatopsis acidiphila]UIJ57602.1 hypothetical protein LWP59_26070 [Amycolatopsis acidiphila]